MVQGLRVLVQVPAPIQWFTVPVTPVPGDLMSSLDLHKDKTHM